MTALVDRAQAIATTAHAGQTDKTGAAYIDHPARVAVRVCQYAPPGQTEAAQVVAWLHDVVEDTAVSLEELEAQFPAPITAAVDAVTKRAGEEPEAYYRRVVGNELARAVKHADLDDNTDPARVARLDPETRSRLEAKYARARAVLSGKTAQGHVDPEH